VGDKTLYHVVHRGALVVDVRVFGVDHALAGGFVFSEVFCDICTGVVQCSAGFCVQYLIVFDVGSMDMFFDDVADGVRCFS